MRKTFAALLATALVGVLAAAALAATFEQHSVITLTAKKAGQSTGFNSNVYSTFPGGTKPPSATRLVVTFPAGTKFNVGKFPACRLSDAQLTGSKTCPSASQIGSGSARALAWPLGLTVKSTAKGYVGGSNSMILVVSVTSPVKQKLVIHMNVSGPKLSIKVPTPTVLGNQVILTGLQLSVPAKQSGRNALATAGKCVGGKFAITSQFSYSNHTTATVSSTSPCT